MATFDTLTFEPQSDRFYIHFDVTDHFLKLETFVRTAQQAQRIVGALDETFFAGKLQYELIVLPPEEGSFLTRLAIWVGATAGLVFTLIESDVGKAYIEGLTGHEPAFWVKQVGEIHRQSTYFVAGQAENALSTVPTSVERECKVGAKIVAEMTKGILQKENLELERIGMTIGNLEDAVEARNDFYLACLEDADVKRVGFERKDDFPIPRQSFAERAVKRIRKEPVDEPLPWQVAIENIFVTSPNWDKDDQLSRQWKGKDATRRDCYFTIEDEEFWFHVRKKDLNVDVLDNLKVQWAFQSQNGRIKNRRVLRVLEFNHEKLAEPLSDAAILSILGPFSEASAGFWQPSLFDDEPKRR